MSGILKNDGSFPLALNGWEDHVHVFFELPVNMSVSKQMQLLKSASSKWINDRRLVKGKFSWQEGYGAFSYARSQRNAVIQYIKDQEAHHSKKTFREEYMELLNDYRIAFDEKYVFEFYD
jgi:REP element-mobilizing transposase RayT